MESVFKNVLRNAWPVNHHKFVISAKWDTKFLLVTHVKMDTIRQERTH